MVTKVKTVINRETRYAYAELSKRKTVMAVKIYLEGTKIHENVQKLCVYLADCVDDNFNTKRGSSKLSKGNWKS